MATVPHRRQVTLFLLAVVLPSVTLVVLGARMISQEQELARKRLADERRRAIADVRQRLIAELERIKVTAVSAVAGQGMRTRSYGDPAVELAAPVDDGRVVTPWEAHRVIGSAPTTSANSVFETSITRGERAELVDGDLTVAIAAYRSAVRAARHERTETYGRLLLARALSQVERDAEALELYSEVLAAPSDVTDEHGVPLALYAAARLVPARQSLDQVRGRLQEQLDATNWHAPATAYLIRDLTAAIVGSSADGAEHDEAIALSRAAAAEIGLIERAIALQQDFPRLGLRYGDSETDPTRSPWIPYQQGQWLVSAASVPGVGSHVVVALDARKVLNRVEQAPTATEQFGARFEFRTGANAEGELVGPELPGLKVAFLDTSEERLEGAGGPQRTFYLLVLLLVVSVTVFGGYLLLRDVRRELRLAALQSQFVSSVSHELKTPLTAIRMLAETLRTKKNADPAVQADYLDMIVGESERLTRLLNNVLDLSKIEQDQKAYRREPASLVDITKQAVRTLEYPFTQEGFTVDMQVENGLPLVPVDADAVEQAVLNLLTNAMKYSGDAREIALRVRRENGYVVIEVTDHGAGVPAGERERLTERFYRGRSPENDRIPGTGLGLTLVDHIVRAHEGHLTVSSAVGEGSTFAIHLPLEQSI